MITSEEDVHDGMALMKLAGTDVLSGIVRDDLAGAHADDGARPAWLISIAEDPEGHVAVLLLAGDDLGVSWEVDDLPVSSGKRVFQNAVHGESPV
jgi:hypothetical protein